MPATLWIRADGSAALGLGHVMRSIALAQAARRRSMDARYVVTRDPVAVGLPARFGFDVRELSHPDDRRWLGELGPDDVVHVDGYHFTADLLHAITRVTSRVGAMTDLRQGRFPVAVLVNQNPVGPVDYDCLAGTKVLLGPDHALIREEFFPHRRAHGQTATRALVTMGGSDASGHGVALANRIADLRGDVHVTLLRGPAAAPVRPDRIEVVSDPPDLPATFASADLAISAAGSTTWELLYLGIPTALVQVADNQASIGPGVQRAGAGLFLGTTQEVWTNLPGALEQLTDPASRASLTAAAMRLVDGEGADRVLDALLAAG